MSGKCRALLAAVILASPLLTACGSSPATPPPDVKATGDAAFAYNIQHRHMAGTGFFTKLPTPTVEKLGRAVCSELQSGMSAMDVDGELLQTKEIPSSEPPEHLGEFVTASVVAYCPKEESKLTG